jgi:hypothetical protein
VLNQTFQQFEDWSADLTATSNEGGRVKA